MADVGPSDLEHFSDALRADVQGIQVDFDDGHCPTWRNQIAGLYNVYQAVRGYLPNVPHISKGPILMFRPRAWNMTEHNMSVKGKEVPGPLFDFALLIYHNARELSRHEVGPCFYLAKLEDAKEATLWNDIFTWSEQILEIPYGTIKACDLIENILAAFQAELILYALRDHSLGLNCGIWDYSASIISKFGANESFLMPDRERCVNMSKPFLRNYMKLVIWVCHKRGTYATGGMVAEILPSEVDCGASLVSIVHKVCCLKRTEIRAGVDGFLVYDLKLVPHLNELWSEYGKFFSRESIDRTLTAHPEISVEDLLTLPVGGVTTRGIMHNISVAILFIFNWLNGKGHFIYEGFVEDSATAEISRSQIWQWIRHGAQLEDLHGKIVTRGFILEYASRRLAEITGQYAKDDAARENMSMAFNLFVELVNHRNFPEFITSYLNNQHTFRNIDANL